MDYPALSAAGLILPGCLLFMIYGVSVAVRTTQLGQKISIFETGQAMVAFLLAASSVLYFEPPAQCGSGLGLPAVFGGMLRGELCSVEQ